MTALALSLAYLGSLAFAAWLLWLRRSTIGRAHHEVLAGALNRIAKLEARADPGELDKRIEALERRAESANLGRAFGGGR